MIYIIGLGPGSREYLTLEAYETIKSADHVYLRTQEHPTLDHLDAFSEKFTSFDFMYNESENFEEVYEKIAEDIIEKSKESKDIYYAVPGNPLVAETSVQLILNKAKAQGLDCKIVYGTSFIDAMLTTLRKDPVDGLSIVDGMKIDAIKINTEIDHIVIQLYDQMIASEVKLVLSELYGDDHEVIISKGAGIPGQEEVHHCMLYEIDHDPSKLDHLTSLYVPKREEKLYDFEDLMNIISTLRGENGCPWDKEQTHNSLIPCLQEEAQEVIDAIENDDEENLNEELGDLLLQVAFHTHLQEEKGYYNRHDMLEGICSKMIRRHPHVFGDIDLNNAEEVLVQWNEIKRKEKEGK